MGKSKGRERKGVGGATIEAAPSAARSLVEVPGGQSLPTSVGQ